MSRINAYKSSKVSGSVMCQISTAQNDQKQKNEEYIKTLIDITLFLAKQGIAFRGHLEDKESNNQGIIVFIMHNRIFICLFHYLSILI